MASIPLVTNVASLNAERRLGEGTSALRTSFKRLSSGLRINKPDDDAAGLSISESLKADVRIFNQGVRNVNDGISVLSIADGALGQLSDLLIRMRELATEAANGTPSTKQRCSLDEEALALAKEFNRIARTTSFNGVNIFDGTASDTALQAGYSQLSFNVGGAVGDGTFQAKHSLATGAAPVSVAVGDFNGDGIEDLASADLNAGTVSVLLGKGDGTFQARQSFATGAGPNGVTVGDFNGDGIEDLASANSDDNTVSVLLGKGDGTFQAKQSFATGAAPVSVAVGDFNGDGIEDLASADLDADTVSVLLGKGDGTFQAKRSLATGAGPSSVATGDFNGDGIEDLVSSDELSNTVSVLLGKGDGTFGPRQSFATGAGPNSVTVGDFNGDGLTDLVTSDYGGGAGTTVSVLLGKGDGTFQSRQSFATGAGPLSLAIGDFNGDGVEDLASADYGADTVSVLLGKGDGTFRARQPFATGAGPSSVATGDFNGDGVTDLASADYNANTASVLLGTSLHGVSALQAFSLTSRDAAKSAMTYFAKVQTWISSQRGIIGAFESRAQVAFNTLAVSSEEFTAAQSRITDVDVADESASLVKHRIQQEAAAAILSQANQEPTLALTLLRAA